MRRYFDLGIGAALAATLAFAAFNLGLEPALDGLTGRSTDALTNGSLAYAPAILALAGVAAGLLTPRGPLGPAQPEAGLGLLDPARREAGLARASRSETILPSSSARTAASSASLGHPRTIPSETTTWHPPSELPLWNTSGWGTPTVMNSGRRPICGLARMSRCPTWRTRSEYAFIAGEQET